MNSYQAIISKILCILIGVSGISACEEAPPDVEPRLRSVRYVQVENPEQNRVRTFSGVSQAGQESRLSFKVSGNIQTILVSVGERLQPGQLIAELDPSTYQLEVQQAQAALAQAQATERNAQANYKRVRGLYENNNASRNELDTARANADSSKAQVRASRKSVDLAQLNTSYTKLTANAACSVADVMVEANENVTAGQQVALVTCGDSVEINVPIPESVIASVRTGMNAMASFDAIPGQRFNGIVTEVGVAASGATFPVTVAVPDTNSELRSGLAAQVSFRFETQTGQNAFILPAAAVGEDQDGRFVFKLKETDANGTTTVSRQVVETGDLTSGGIEILDGVSQGDRIITAGVSVVRDGMRVLAD